MEKSNQILENETFIPVLLQRQEDGYAGLKRCIVIGDHHQLPPIVKNMAFQTYSHICARLSWEGQECPFAWFYQIEEEAEYIVSVYIYAWLQRYPANKISNANVKWEEALDS
ncbi:Intron-binding protein aquarius [Trema orientale]|uniref:Intron-binding protein aquarius n=1 Tax=Trema orientale TaxID=63057 RepID=A0A2P5EGY9_TREOI|nr:Intron-binding protein aquarius [Trema orientale]